MDFTFILLSTTFLLTGLLSGFIAGLLGVGGGIIIVPVSYFVLLYLGYSSSLIMHISVASSLGVIVFTSMSSIISHYKLGNIDYKVINKWVLGIIIGSLIGSFLASKIEGELLFLIFVILLFFISISMFFQKNYISIREDLPKNFLINSLISGIIGFLSSLMGIGGGSFSVPTLNSFSKSIHKAVGSSAVLGFFIALPAVIIYSITGREIDGLPPYSLGYVNLIIVFLVSVTSVFTANIGAKISSRTKTSTLKKIFAVFLICTCISLIIENLIY